MKRYLLLALFGVAVLDAQSQMQHLQGSSTIKAIAADASVSSVSITREGQRLKVEMALDLASLRVGNNRAVVLTPIILRGEKSQELASVGVYGRRRYFVSRRNDWFAPELADEWIFNQRHLPPNVEYRESVPYNNWMNGAQLVILRREYGCHGELLAERYREVATYEQWQFWPIFVYVQPEAEAVKMRNVEGSAFIDFPLSQTDIRPSFRDNSAELGKIVATIDSIRSDEDITLRSISIKGFASPEGPYDNNARLACGRTQSLREYVEGLYDFPLGFIATSYEPENWQGLRAYVEASTLANREGILQIIDGPLAPDEKNESIKARYPNDYALLLGECYPALRRSDYRIEYEVRHFSDVEQIIELVRTAPQKLSLEEFYLAAESVGKQSPMYGEIFETAVRMYPDDEVANLNAASSAMIKGNLIDADRYLDRAGSSPEAEYARGIYAILRKDYPVAEAHFALAGNLPQVELILPQLEWLKREQ